MSKLNLKADALAAYETALSAPNADWRSVAELLRAVLPRERAKPHNDNAITDYPIKRYKTDRVGPTCVVTFADGQTCRMSTATLPGKPLNVGRGLRLCVAAWQSRKGRPSPELREIVGRMLHWSLMNRARLDAYCARRLSPSMRKPPTVIACHFERDGEVIDTYDANACNRHLEAA